MNLCMFLCFLLNIWMKLSECVKIWENFLEKYVGEEILIVDFVVKQNNSGYWCTKAFKKLSLNIAQKHSSLHCLWSLAHFTFHEGNRICEKIIQELLTQKKLPIENLIGEVEKMKKNRWVLVNTLILNF